MTNTELHCDRIIKYYRHMKPTYFLICTLLSVTIQAQDFSEKILQKMGDEDLLTLFNEIDSDSIKAEKVARVYLNRARKEKDTIKMARGYEKLARIFNPQKNILFADSIIYLTKNMDNITYPALGYMIKGYEYSGMGNLVLANKNDIIVYELAVKNENIAHQLFITDKLIGAKSFWGNKREALEMQKKRHDLVNSKDYYKGLRASVREGAQIDFKDIYLENEISSIRNFVVCYINLKVLDSATMYLNKGLKKLYKYKGYKSFRDYNIEWFIVTSAEIDFYKGNFNKSLDTINKLLLSRNNTNNDSWVLKELYYFKGLMLINLGKNNEGIENLKKADSIFVENNILFKPYHREMYVKLLEHYTVKNDVNKKVKYLNKLIYVDSIFIRNYQFFEPDMIRNFETPKLIKEKEKLIASLKQENKKSSVATLSILGALGISLFGLWYFFRKQQIYKKRFTVLMSQNSNKVIN